MPITMILSHTPTWVWGMLAALLALGLLQLRTRRVSRAQLLALPLVLLGLGLWSLAPGFAAQPVAALAWLGALAAFAALGLRLPRPAQARWLAGTQRLQLPGSWVPMALIVAIFCLRYATGVAMALHPQWRTDAAVQLTLAALFGALSGIFIGRALGLLRLTRQPATTIASDVSLRPL
jgi:hypothetical protein